MPGFGAGGWADDGRAIDTAIASRQRASAKRRIILTVGVSDTPEARLLYCDVALPVCPAILAFGQITNHSAIASSAPAATSMT